MNGSAKARIGIGVLLLAIGISGVLALGSWQRLLAGFSPDGTIVAYSWLVLRIMLIALIAPALALIAAPTVRRLIRECHLRIRRLPTAAFLTCTLAASALLRIAAVVVLPLNLHSDYATYDRLGWLWATHGEYTDGTGPTAYYPPGWPFVLSRLYLIFGHHPQTGIVVNLVFGVVTVYLTWRLVRAIWGEFRARWATAIVAIMPSGVLFVNVLGSESLFTVLLMLSLTLLLPRHGRGPRSIVLALVGGATLGFATLTRSVTLLFPLLLIPAYSASQLGIRRTAWRWAALVAGLLIVVAPWMARNLAQVGRATVATNTGVNLYIGNNPNTGIGYTEPDPRILHRESASDEAHVDSTGWALGVQYIREHPLVFLARGVLKTVYLFAADTDALMFELERAASNGVFDRYCALALVMQSFWMVFLLAVVIGVVRSWRTQSWGTSGGLLLAGTILYWIVVHFVSFSSGRFHFPIVPLMAAFAARTLTPPEDR